MLISNQRRTEIEGLGDPVTERTDPEQSILTTDEHRSTQMDTGWVNPGPKPLCDLDAVSGLALCRNGIVQASRVVGYDEYLSFRSVRPTYLVRQMGARLSLRLMAINSSGFHGGFINPSRAGGIVGAYGKQFEGRYHHEAFR